MNVTALQRRGEVPDIRKSTAGTAPDFRELNGNAGGLSDRLYISHRRRARHLRIELAYVYVDDLAVSRSGIVDRHVESLEGGERSREGQRFLVGIDEPGLGPYVDRHQRKKDAVFDGKRLNIRASILYRLVNGALLPQKSDHVFADIPRCDARTSAAVKEDLDRLRNSEPRETTSKTERSHGVVTNTGGEQTQRSVDRSVGIASDDDLPRSPKTLFNDHVVDTAVARIEQVPNPVLKGETTHGCQSLSCLLRGRREV